jgi:hypothetical protein
MFHKFIVLVLGGVHVVPNRIGRLSELRFKSEGISVESLFPI